MDILIHDKREGKDFGSLTFSDYKKSEVIKALGTALNKPDIEGALYWSVELICTGKLKELWDVVLLVMSKNIHLGNPKLPMYISDRFSKFREIVQNGYVDRELMLRNLPSIRELFGEIIIIVCLSSKKPALEMIKINRSEDFSLELLGHKLKADSMNWCKKVFREKDPNEVLLPINEFAYHLEKKNLLRCCYWIEWLIDYDTICRRSKSEIKAEPRDFVRTHEKYQNDCIWMIWELLLDTTKKSEPKKKIMLALLDLFSLKYNFAQKKKRRHMLYFAVELITEHTDMNIQIVRDVNRVNSIKNQVGKLYAAIKKYEQPPDIISDKERSMKNTIDKMNILYNYENKNI